MRRSPPHITVDADRSRIRLGTVTSPDTPAPAALVRATAAEAPGATLVVGGLRVLDRSIKQLRRLGYPVVLAGEPTLTESCAGVEARALDGAGLDALRAKLRPAVEVGADEVRPRTDMGSSVYRVTDQASRARAEDAVFAELLRGDLGLVARTLNKPISIRITRHLLCHLPLTPNQVTVLAGLVGLVGAALVALGHSWSIPAGFLLAHVQSVLDGCDGELARVRLQQSAIGEWLDTVVDDALNLALTVAMGIGFSRAHHRPFDLIAALVAAAMLITYSSVAYRELIRQGEGGEVLKVRWWFTGGSSFKGLYGRPSGGPAGGRGAIAFSVLTTLGRRDFFVFAWLALAVLQWHGLILLYAFVLALANFIGAMGQLIWRR